MTALGQKQQQSETPKGSSAPRRRSEPSQQSHPIVQLQRILGNQAVLRLIRAGTPNLGSGFNPATNPVAHDAGKITVGEKAPAAIQKQSLTVNTPGDVYEQEAERVADQVMRMPAPRLQRACACGGQCPTCQKDEHDDEHRHLQAARAPASGGESVTAPPIVHDVLRAGGRSLDLATRHFMEPRFGFDFSDVRVHTDARAGQSARAIDALAYTVGRDVVFAEGQYAPETAAGKHLLAHELTHVIQQGHGSDSGLVHRQPPPQSKTTAATDCVQPGADQHMKVEAGAVTVIAYGNTSWCAPCIQVKKDMEDLCKALTKPAVPVRFYDVEIDDITAPPAKTWPPFSGSGFPQLLIYAGQFQLFHESSAPSAADLKQKVDKAISCANKPWTCGPIVPTNCNVIAATQSTPTGTRFIFNEGTVDFASGEESALVRFAKGVKAAGPGSTINILGMAMGGGDEAWKKSLSCHRALAADAIFRAEGLAIGTTKSTGGVPGTETNHGFRAVDIDVQPAAAPATQTPGQTPQGEPQKGQPAGGGLQTLPGTNTCTTPPNCVFDAVIKGPTLIEDKAKDPKATGMPRQQTASCTHYLFQIVPTTQTTGNTQILHVQWKKDPPPNTLSITRTAEDDEGDVPAGKAPSYAALNASKPADPSKNAFAVDTLPNCKTTLTLPSWCVPFCSFGTFVMDASVIWQCDPTNCKRNNIFKVPTFTITVKEKP